MEATLKENEYHPIAPAAMSWFRQWKARQGLNYLLIREAIASDAIGGNRLAEICNSTLVRLEKGEPVSDRYLLGLCWFLRDNFDVTK
ncbi:hypothetical protein A2Z56_02520 [Candidatus Kaiserbacteria bacterium RIFCSPHIGHO2_12_45_16]|nr:MAG: hypothetical protein A2Z56_02520 [Candidatus Kaiserbacteria bacterium RIFCSPHIGHO2_12_45_16]